MAKPNILNGTFQGSLGTLTGSPTKNRRSIRKKVFIKQLPNNQQKEQLLAFVYYNRVVTKITKTLHKTHFPKIAYKNYRSTMTHKWRTAIQSGSFSLSSFKNIFPTHLNLLITYTRWSSDPEILEINISPVQNYVSDFPPVIYVGIFDNYGACSFSDTAPAYGAYLKCRLPAQYQNQYNLIALVQSTKGSRSSYTDAITFANV